jgi:uncharacterized protein (TIGR00369 family)
MTGLDEIKALIERGKRPPMMELFDIDLEEVEAGHVVFAATPDRQSYNLMNIVHGGYAAILLDSACGIAASSAAREPVNCVTLELKIAYHAAITDRTGRLRATGAVLSMGKRVAHTEAKLVDESGRLYASATSTLLLSERK